MPVKRRQPKLRRDPQYDAEFWGDFFDLGYFLLAGWESELGLPQPRNWREVSATEHSPTVLDAAREAWARLGADYMAGRIGSSHRADDPEHGAWALERFGPPP